MPFVYFIRFEMQIYQIDQVTIFTDKGDRYLCYMVELETFSELGL